MTDSALGTGNTDQNAEHASRNSTSSAPEANRTSRSLDPVPDPELLRSAVALFRYTREISAHQARILAAEAQIAAESSRPTGGFVTPKPPTVLRTVYRQPVKGLMTHPTYDRGLEEHEYDEYRDSASGSAIELKKDVRVIPPKSLSGVRSINGTQDIIDHIVSERMIIRSPALIRTIKSVVSYWPSSAYYDNQTRLELNRPYRSICVYRAEFQNALESDKAEYKRIPPSEKSSKDAKELAKSIEELEMLLVEVDKVQKDPVAEEKRRNMGDEGRQIPPKATFDMLWMLYKPGEEVYVQTEDFEGLCRIRLLVWDRGRALSTDADDPYASVELNLWYLDHDGECLCHTCLGFTDSNSRNWFKSSFSLSQDRALPRRARNPRAASVPYQIYAPRIWHQFQANRARQEVLSLDLQRLFALLVRWTHFSPQVYALHQAYAHCCKHVSVG
jgi:hypothetical protein